MFQKIFKLSTVSLLKIIASLAVISILLSACSPYKMDIQQGNVIETERLAHLKVGMTEAQVRYVLGSPLMKDDFHKNRWDYVFYLKKSGLAGVGKETIEKKSVTIFFKNGRVTEIKQ